MDSGMKEKDIKDLYGSGADVPVERHPLEPFLPDSCRVLFLGSFPPPRHRWSMEFFYPNFINDHWRILGLVFFGDRNHFVDAGAKTFRLPLIREFLEEKGIGYYDTARAVRRLSGNASDKDLEVVEVTDISALTAPLHSLGAIAVTGERSAITLCGHYGLTRVPAQGSCIELPSAGLPGQASRVGYPGGLRLYRLPSSSRAYPLAIEKKAEAYAAMFIEQGLL